jgi:hypothetical protein
MTRQDFFGIVGVSLIALSAAVSLAAWSGGQQADAATQSASKAAQASPELVGALSKELGSTPEQAAGAAGALFGVAKSRLAANDFSTVSNAVPGMDLLLKAAPQSEAGPAGLASLSKMAGSASGLASAASAFSRLGLSPDLVPKAVPVLTSFVSKSGGANVGNLLAGVLK